MNVGGDVAVFGVVHGLVDLLARLRHALVDLVDGCCVGGGEECGAGLEYPFGQCAEVIIEDALPLLPIIGGVVAGGEGFTDAGRPQQSPM